MNFVTNINDVSVTWRKALRRVWGLWIMHSDHLTPMCNLIPIFDELCRRDRNFINSILISDIFLISSIAVYGVYFGRMSSLLGRNTNFCCKRFNSSLCCFSQRSSKFIISKVMASLPDDEKSIIGLVSVLSFLRDGSFWLPTSFLKTIEVNSLISYACRM